MTHDMLTKEEKTRHFFKSSALCAIIFKRKWSREWSRDKSEAHKLIQLNMRGYNSDCFI